MLRKIAYFYQSLIALFAMLFVDAVLSSSQLVNLTELFFSRVLPSYDLLYQIFYSSV